MRRVWPAIRVVIVLWALPRSSTDQLTHQKNSSQFQSNQRYRKVFTYSSVLGVLPPGRFCGLWIDPKPSEVLPCSGRGSINSDSEIRNSRIEQVLPASDVCTLASIKITLLPGLAMSFLTCISIISIIKARGLQTSSQSSFCTVLHNGPQAQ